MEFGDGSAVRWRYHLESLLLTWSPLVSLLFVMTVDWNTIIRVTFDTLEPIRGKKGGWSTKMEELV